MQIRWIQLRQELSPVQLLGCTARQCGGDWPLQVLQISQDSQKLLTGPAATQVLRDVPWLPQAMPIQPRSRWEGSRSVSVVGAGDIKAAEDQLPSETKFTQM